mmetsp:Transcript_14452/g.30915  ORF Transcript_14452/g.30915 Transcript_14452/m.30915 type:complete len:91 (+) Transcript_14452:129-401(+)|eukprot:CAMPEP_0118933980 /NCGR_PEP_ID=MMETSP1169-20130426/13204_1 /TAXON_ID=36882 /ORGANISM="Pyramimonas obovata, Strain CCMP722" /LENGTH=90 /DNA_ID=CAMNT_0006876831 /DNA_START=128 /DNA_END=400 /DNA_ORIENTATION=+
MADLQQQVKNSTVTAQQMSEAFQRKKMLGISGTKKYSHCTALQDFTNGEPVPYSKTLRIVVHDESVSHVMTEVRKAPGYIRNELGGMFTS